MRRWQIVLGETGEYRQVSSGEWFLWSNGKMVDRWLSPKPTISNYLILREVSQVEILDGETTGEIEEVPYHSEEWNVCNYYLDANVKISNIKAPEFDEWY
jgi:hypothetical protein